MTTHRTPLTRSIEIHLRVRPERIDWFVVGVAALLCLLGIAFLASATRGDGGLSGLALRQVVYGGLGVAAFLAIQRIDYLTLLRASPALYLVGLLMLCAVLFTRPVNGARSWFDLYFFKLQPSEVMKPVLILTLAYYLMYRDSYRRLAGLAVPLVLCLAPMALILKQPDLGTTLVLVPVIFGVLYAAAARLWHLGLMVLAGCAGFVAMWFTIVKDYQKRRVLAWLYPEDYALREAWQLLKSETAIGSGGFAGNGLGSSAHAGLESLPERHTDFIFSVVGHEGGFLLCLLLVALLAALTVGGLAIAARTREPAGRLIAVGVSVLLGGQALVNLGVALGLLPTTGVTMPLVSYGGSSMISSFICLGLLVNVGARQEPVFGGERFG